MPADFFEIAFVYIWWCASGWENSNDVILGHFSILSLGSCHFPSILVLKLQWYMPIYVAHMSWFLWKLSATHIWNRQQFLSSIQLISGFYTTLGLPEDCTQFNISGHDNSARHHRFGNEEEGGGYWRMEKLGWLETTGSHLFLGHLPLYDIPSRVGHLIAYFLTK